jgi:hypothetical protein
MTACARLPTPVLILFRFQRDRMTHHITNEHDAVSRVNTPVQVFRIVRVTVNNRVFSRLSDRTTVLKHN